MKAKSIQALNSEELATKIGNIGTDGFIPTLAFVFMSLTEELNKVAEILSLKNIAIFGTTTSGEFTEEGLQEAGICILLLDVDPEHFKLEIKDLENNSTIEASKQIGRAGLSAFTNPGFLVSAADLSTPGEFIIEGISDVAGPNTIIIGGMAGEPIFFKGFVFTGNEFFSKGIISLIFNLDHIDMKGLAVSGWKPVGTNKVVTKCDNSWIMTIDEKPALDVIKQFMGDELLLDEKVGSNHVIRLNTTFPLQVQRKDGYSVMRPTLLANLENKSVLCGGKIEEGDIFRFSLPPDFDVIDEVINSSKEIKAKELEQAEAMIVFSCVGRLESLGPLLDSEIEGLANTWGCPMAGFLCLGEFGRPKGGNISEFYGTTCSWVALKEK